MKADEPTIIYLADPRKWNARLIVRKAVKHTESQVRNPERLGNWELSLHLKIWTVESPPMAEDYVLETIKVSGLRKN